MVPLGSGLAAELHVPRSSAQIKVDYVAALSDAIAAWSALLADADPSSFLYRGVDLRCAVERVMYFALVNDSAAYATFAAQAAGIAPATAPPNQSIYRFVAPCLVGRRSGAEDSSGDFPRKLGWLPRLNRQVKRFAGRQHPDFDLERVDGRPNVLFLAIQPKFVRFLLPIMLALDDDAAFLTVGDLATEKYLKKMELPTLSVRLASAAQSGVNGILGDFAYLCRTFDAIEACIEQTKPRVLVVPEGNAPDCEVARLAARRAGVPTICIQHGWSPVSHPGFRNLMFDEMLVWGSLFADLLAPENPLQHFAIVGNPTRFETARRLRSFQPIRAIGFFLQKGGPLIDATDWTSFLDLIGWTAASFPDVEIIAREHPSTSPLDDRERSRIGDHSNMQFMSAVDCPLGDILARCDIVVAAYSTTLLEAVAAGAIPFIFGASGMARYRPDLASVGVAIEEKQLAAAKVSLGLLIADCGMRERLRKAGEAFMPCLFAATGKSAVERIVSTIRSAGMLHGV